MEQLTENGRTPLTQLYVYVTNRCNCACAHCWIVPGHSAPGRSPSHDLDLDLLGRALEEAIPLGLQCVKWTGGEPTIHPDFPGMLELQKRFGLSGRIETNGIEMTPALARLCVDTGVRYVAVSLDGAAPDTHDAIRGVRGAHRRAIAGVKALREAGLAPQIIMSLMRANVSELVPLLRLAEREGASSVKLNIVQPTLRGADIYASGGALSVREILELSSRLAGDLAAVSSLRVFLDVPMAFRPISRIVDQGGCSICGIRRILGLLADGHYALCGIGEHLRELVFGQAGVGGLEAIWTSHPQLVRLRAGLPKELKGICGRCLLKGACMGACVAQNYYRSHDLMAPHWFCEEAEEAGLFPPSRRR